MFIITIDDFNALCFLKKGISLICHLPIPYITLYTALFVCSLSVLVTWSRDFPSLKQDRYIHTPCCIVVYAQSCLGCHNLDSLCYSTGKSTERHFFISIPESRNIEMSCEDPYRMRNVSSLRGAVCC